jgi:hypothetical protein
MRPRAIFLGRLTASSCIQMPQHFRTNAGDNRCSFGKPYLNSTTAPGLILLRPHLYRIERRCPHHCGATTEEVRRIITER